MQTRDEVEGLHNCRELYESIKKGNDGGGEGRIVSSSSLPFPPLQFISLSLQLWLKNANEKACYAGKKTGIP